MLTHQRKPVCLSLISTDMPIWSVVETAASLYQKDRDRFHLVLSEPVIVDKHNDSESNNTVIAPDLQKNRLIWLEISPYRVIMTMQGNGNFSYRHFWERGTYGLSRYWLQNQSAQTHNGQMRLRNFTRNLTFVGDFVPEYLRLEYELWSENLQLGRYVLSLEIMH